MLGLELPLFRNNTRKCAQGVPCFNIMTLDIHQALMKLNFYLQDNCVLLQCLLISHQSLDQISSFDDDESYFLDIQ